MMEMTPRERITATLRGEKTDKIPFTTYEEKLPRSSRERILRNQGLCLVKRTRSYGIHYPNVKYRTMSQTDAKGRYVTTHIYSTPYGDLERVTEAAGFTTWTHEYPFKTPEDYKALRFLLHDGVVTESYAAASRLTSELGPDYTVRDNLCLEPLQDLILFYMGTETFCIEWMENRDEVLLLYRELVETARKIYPIVANGPLSYANYGGNVTPEIIGRKVFQEFYCPNYAEAAEIFHKSGKLIGTHLDGNNTLIMDDIAQAPLDYIEAFDAGMGPSLAEACQKWPDKVIWLNFPSAWHFHSAEEIYDDTLKLIQEGQGAKGLIIGITEDTPPDRLPGILEAIRAAIDAQK